ncbi:MAG: type II toxin-antitoxin system RatA family toxin [Bdellovibrionales bacterium]
MPRYSETHILPYFPEQIFDLVADVERYPDFLPWCHSVHIIETREKGFIADMVVGNKLVSEGFRSEVSLLRPLAVSVAYGGGGNGVLRHLATEWRFVLVDKTACRIDFMVDFSIKSRLLAGAMDLFFEKAFLRIVAAFEARAAALYGKKASLKCNHRL